MKFLFLLCLLVSSYAHSEIISQVVEYQARHVMLKGYLVYDNSIHEKRPAVIVVHEWWGITDYPKKRAEMLASLGYVALAADMYGNGKRAETPADAQAYAGESMSDMELLKEKFNAAIQLLKKNEHVDSVRIAAIGYCYGGGIVLNMARAGMDIAGVVSFHGSLAEKTPLHPGKFKTKVLVCNGSADTFISKSEIEDFKKEFKHAGADMQFISYKGAVHAFTNPEATELGKKFHLPIAYSKHADQQSWKELQRFLKRIFK